MNLKEKLILLLNRILFVIIAGSFLPIVFVTVGFICDYSNMNLHFIKDLLLLGLQIDILFICIIGVFILLTYLMDILNKLINKL